MIHYIRRNLTFMCPDCLSDFSGGEESTSPLQTVQISHPRYAGKVKIMSKVEKIELLRLILTGRTTIGHWGRPDGCHSEPLYSKLSISFIPPLSLFL